MQMVSCKVAGRQLFEMLLPQIYWQLAAAICFSARPNINGRLLLICIFASISHGLYPNIIS